MVYSNTNKLTHICAIKPTNTTLSAFRRPYFIKPFLTFFVHTSRSRDIVAVSSLSQQSSTADMANKCRNRSTDFGHLWPPEDWNLANISKHWIISENYPNQYEVYSMISIPDNGPKPPMAMFWPPEGKKWSTWPNIYSFRKTCIINAYTKYEVDSVISILENGQKPSVLELFSGRQGLKFSERGPN